MWDKVRVYIHTLCSFAHGVAVSYRNLREHNTIGPYFAHEHTAEASTFVFSAEVLAVYVKIPLPAHQRTVDAKALLLAVVATPNIIS